MSALGRGKSFERTVAKRLSQWLTEGTTDSALARQSMMGRMVEKIYGDIVPNPNTKRWKAPAMWFSDNFVIDAKNRQAFRVVRLLNPGCPFWEWWEKLSEDAAMCGGRKRMMILLNKPGCEKILALGSAEVGWLKEKIGDFPFPLLKVWRHPTADATEAAFFCDLDQFLRAVSPVTLGRPEPGQVAEEVL